MPCGGLASTVPDLAKFISLLMRAGQADVTPICGGTLMEMQTPQRLTEGWKSAVGLGWQITPDGGIWATSSGTTAGRAATSRSSGFVPRKKIGVIVLGNAAREVDSLGGWLLTTA